MCHLARTCTGCRQRRAPFGLLACVVGVALAGCRAPLPGSGLPAVSLGVEERMGYALERASCRGEVVFPPGAALDDGLTEDEAISIALWNNALFQETLVEAGVARAELVAAGLLPNPEFVYLFGVDHKPFRYAFELPIEAIWLRPIRLRAARGEAERTTERLVQAGLDLIRDVRQAYADAVLARERARIAQELLALRQRVAELAEARLAAGDASPQEPAAARIDALAADQEAVRTTFDLSAALERLRLVLGIIELRDAIPLDEGSTPRQVVAADERAADDLVAEALANRPDILAADRGVAAARERVRLAQAGWFRLLGIGDATAGLRTGHEFGPALRFTVPLFNKNEGEIARARAALERAVRQRQTVRQQAAADLRRALVLYEQARAELATLETRVEPEVQAAIGRAERAYREGEAPYLIVLEATRQLTTSQLRAVQLDADLRRAYADIERGLGRKLSAPKNEPPAEIVAPPTLTEDIAP